MFIQVCIFKLFSEIFSLSLILYLDAVGHQEGHLAHKNVLPATGL